MKLNPSVSRRHSRSSPRIRRVSLAVGLSAAVVSAGCITAAPHEKIAPTVKQVVDKQGDGTLVTSFAEVNGTWLRVRTNDTVRDDAGHLPVVMVHGYGSRLEAYRNLQPALSSSRRTLSFDQRGFGESERVEGEYGPDVHARDLIALIKLAGLDRVILVGHSYGGGVATRAALLAPDLVAGVVLVDAFLLDRQMPQAFRWAKAPVVGELLFGAFYKEVPGEKYLLAFEDNERFVTAKALDEMKEMMSRDGAVYAALETVRGMNYASWDKELDRLQPPTLVIWGEQDRVTPLAQGRALAARLDSANFVVIPGSGHMPLWERPNAVLAAVVPFLKQIDDAERDRPTVHDLPSFENAWGAPVVETPAKVVPTGGDDGLPPEPARDFNDAGEGDDVVTPEDASATAPNRERGRR